MIVRSSGWNGSQTLRRRLCLVLALYMMMIAVMGNPQEAVIDAAQGNVYMKEAESQSDEIHGMEDNSISFYGVDVSWPMHHDTISFDRPNNPLGADTRQFAYKEYLQGCIGDETQGASNNYLEECRRFESDRISMNLRQPANSQNYTHAGFAKVETPPGVLRRLQEVWDEASPSSKVLERWERGNTYLNHWESPTYMIDITQILSHAEQQQLVQAVQSVLEAWTQQSLILTSLYGIRVYGNEAVLAPHVDRLPLVSSVIINVAQDVEEPWVLEVIGHDGQATNITMEPGDMVLYESHSVLHGRPFPLKGSYYANVFVHFEPVGHSFRHMQNAPKETARAAYERALAYQQERRAQKRARKEEDIVQSESDDNEKGTDNAPTVAALPHYIPPDKEVRWRQQFEYEKESQISPKPTRVALGDVNPHFAAADGMLDLLKELATKDRSQLFKVDQNGWRPLHEAARAGHVDVIKYLLQEGAQVNERANHEEGGSPLWWAERKGKQNAKAVALLKEYGAVSLAPIPVSHRKKKAAQTKTENAEAPKSEK